MYAVSMPRMGGARVMFSDNATQALQDEDSLLWVIVSPIDIRVLDFTSWKPIPLKMNAVDFNPHATLSIPFICDDILIDGLDKILELLNCAFVSEPFHGLEESFADMMEYGSEPWVYDFRKLLAEADTEYIGLGLSRGWAKDPMSNGIPYHGHYVEQIVAFIPQ
tara:strand:+ start:300 stop:791 length:492 start_codon:yes stop_codon:yes gene_type:complete